MRAYPGVAGELDPHTLRMARTQERDTDTWCAQVQHDVHGQLGRQDGSQRGKAHDDWRGAW